MTNEGRKTMNRLLLVEDDLSLIDGLEYALRREGFAVRTARSVEEAERALGADMQYELLLLDVTLPDGSGFGICERIRRSGSRIPIIFLTAADEETSIIRGLDMGGDDYITKPFRLGELTSRIRALLRRSVGEGGCREQGMDGAYGSLGARLSCGPVEVDLVSARAFLDGKPLELTGAEYRLLCFFMKNEGRLLTRAQILDALWDGNGSFVDDNTLSVYIRRLREKTERDPSAPERLLTVRGLGYRWVREEKRK